VTASQKKINGKNKTEITIQLGGDVLCYQPLHQESFSFGFLNANEMLPFISFP
jgi:hypothetical protein